MGMYIEIIFGAALKQDTPEQEEKPTIKKSLQVEKAKEELRGAIERLKNAKNITDIQLVCLSAGIQTGAENLLNAMDDLRITKPLASDKEDALGHKSKA